MHLHQRLEAFGNRRLASADRAEQVEDLLTLFQPLGGMLEEGNDLVDHLLHAKEFLERGVTADEAVGEQPRQPWVVARIDQFRLADRCEHAFGGGRVSHGIPAGEVQILLERKFGFLRLGVLSLEAFDDIQHGQPPTASE